MNVVRVCSVAPTGSFPRIEEGGTLDASGIVECYSLASREEVGVTTAVVAPSWGANVVGLSFQSHDWTWPVPILEAVDMASVSASPTSYGVPVLAPTPGRVGRNQNGVFKYRGKEYRARPSRHGFLRTLAWTVVDKSPAAIVCVADVLPSRNAAADNAFPFEFRAEYHAKVSLRTMHCRLRIHNTSRRVQPIAAGWHPYLHRSGPCVALVPARSRWELDGEREPTPTGRILEVGPDDDFRKGRLIDTGEHWDDVFTDVVYKRGVAVCWVQESTRILTRDGLRVPTRLRRTVSMIGNSSADGPRPIENIQLYTPPGRNAISIEPLSAPPNAINLLTGGHDRACLCQLDPGKDVVYEIAIGLETAPE